MIRVLLADDQKLARDGWSVLLDDASDISVVGQARDGQETVELARQLRPDIILMDILMPRLNGVKAMRRIIEQQPEVKVLIVALFIDQVVIRAAVGQGAWGYLNKRDEFEELVPAILALHAGQPYFSRTVIEQCPRAVSGHWPRNGSAPHRWQDAAWASLDDRLEHALAEAHAENAKARSVYYYSQTFRDRSQKARAVTQQLLKLRHPDAPTAT